MKVYHSGGSKAPKHTLYIAPAADSKGEVPAEWVNNANEPLNIAVEFTRGMAEVSDEIGKYLVDRGIARKSQLILRDAA